MSGPLCVGLDFDNTIVTYDRVFHKHAVSRGWIAPETPALKSAVRDAIRKNRGNDDWTGLQAFVYGEAMGEAEMAEGLGAFLEWAVRRKARLFVISHKTALAAAAGPPGDLRTPAENWLRAHDFFSEDFLNLAMGEQVFFEETREGKFSRIASLGLTHFIDDLPEFLLDPAFPKGIERIYYNPGWLETEEAAVKNFGSWNEIRKYFKLIADGR